MKIKWLSKKADAMLLKRGWRKTHEGNIIVQYKNDRAKHGYTAMLELGHNSKHPNVVTCYEEAINNDGFNNSIGISVDMLIPIILKLFSIGFMTDNKNKIPWN